MDMVRGEERVRCMERVTWKLTSPYVKQIANGNLLHDAGNPKPVLYDNLRVWDGEGGGKVV